MDDLLGLKHSMYKDFELLLSYYTCIVLGHLIHTIFLLFWSIFGSGFFSVLSRASNYPIFFITRVRVISGIKRTGTRVFTGSRFYTLNLRYFGINFQKYFFKLYFRHNCHHFNSNNHDTRYFWLKYPIIVDNLSKFA